MSTPWWLLVTLWIVLAALQTYRLGESEEMRQLLVEACTETASLAELATDALRECTNKYKADCGI